MSRMDRVNEQLKREISHIIQQDLADPRLQFVTVTGVSTSRDLRSAKVYYSVLGDTQAIESAQIGLQRAGGMIRKLVGQRVKLRYTPEISFRYDKSVEFGAHIEETLKEIHHEGEEDHSADSKG